MNRWLSTRIDGQLERKGSARGERAGADPDRGRAPRDPRAGGRLAHRTDADESTEDAETVRANRATIARALAEDVEDPSTVRNDRLAAALEAIDEKHTVKNHVMPVSFIGESVFDPETQVDSGAAAARWREQAGIDEIDFLTDSSSLEPAQPPKSATPEPPLTPIDEPEPHSPMTIALSLLTGASLGVIAVGLVVYLLR